MGAFLSVKRASPPVHRKRHEPVGVQALRPELALDEGIIRHDVVGAAVFLALRQSLSCRDPGPGAPGARKCGQAVAQT